MRRAIHRILIWLPPAIAALAAIALQAAPEWPQVKRLLDPTIAWAFEQPRLVILLTLAVLMVWSVALWWTEREQDNGERQHVDQVWPTLTDKHKAVLEQGLRGPTAGAADDLLWELHKLGLIERDSLLGFGGVPENYKRPIAAKLRADKAYRKVRQANARS